MKIFGRKKESIKGRCAEGMKDQLEKVEKMKKEYMKLDIVNRFYM